VDYPSEASSDSEDDYGVSGSSDDDWYPVWSGPAPHGVAASNLFGDEDALILKAASLMTDVPVMLTKEIYNDNEQLVARSPEREADTAGRTIHVEHS